MGYILILTDFVTHLKICMIPHCYIDISRFGLNFTQVINSIDGVKKSGYFENFPITSLECMYNIYRNTPTASMKLKDIISFVFFYVGHYHYRLEPNQKIVRLNFFSVRTMKALTFS